jgi:hypothetical protein
VEGETEELDWDSGERRETGSRWLCFLGRLRFSGCRRERRRRFRLETRRRKFASASSINACWLQIGMLLNPRSLIKCR